MSVGDGGRSRLDRQLIDELRSARRRLDPATPLAMKVTLEELDALFRAVDERDELRRQSVGDFEVGFPPVTVTPHVVIPEPGAYAVDADGATPLGREERETPPIEAPTCSGCEGEERHARRGFACTVCGRPRTIPFPEVGHYVPGDHA